MPIWHYRLLHIMVSLPKLTLLVWMLECAEVSWRWR